MKYWLTTHWPPYRNENSGQCHIYLKNEHQGAGKSIRPGDRVLIFETQGGKTHLGARGRRRRQIGGRGIVVIAEVISKLEDSRLQQENYDDGTAIWWRWRAQTRTISDNGFVGWQEVNKVLKYSPDYNMRGFGGLTGLKEINEEQFNNLVKLFNRGNS